MNFLIEIIWKTIVRKFLSAVRVLFQHWIVWTAQGLVVEQTEKGKLGMPWQAAP